jgi:chromosome segregation ATPase
MSLLDVQIDNLKQRIAAQCGTIEYLLDKQRDLEQRLKEAAAEKSRLLAALTKADAVIATLRHNAARPLSATFVISDEAVPQFANAS